MHRSIYCGQIIATSHDLGPQKVAEQGKSHYFWQIQIGEIFFHLARCMDAMGRYLLIPQPICWHQQIVWPDFTVPKHRGAHSDRARFFGFQSHP